MKNTAEQKTLAEHIAADFRKARDEFYASTKGSDTRYRWDSALSHWQDWRNGQEGEEWDEAESLVFPA